MKKRIVKRYKLRKEVKELINVTLILIATVTLVLIMGYVEKYVNF